MLLPDTPPSSNLTDATGAAIGTAIAGTGIWLQETSPLTANILFCVAPFLTVISSKVVVATVNWVTDNLTDWWHIRQLTWKIDRMDKKLNGGDVSETSYRDAYITKSAYVAALSRIDRRRLKDILGEEASRDLLEEAAKTYENRPKSK